MDDVVLRPDFSAATDTEVTTGSENNKSIASHFFAIRSELRRGVDQGSNAHTVRAAFERAVQSDSGAYHCPALWHAYFHFELSRGGSGGSGSDSDARKKATAIFYRSIRACPWAKQLYLLPFRYLRRGGGGGHGHSNGDGGGGMADADLKAVYELMLAKELRIHVDLEEMIEEEREEG